MEVMVAGLGPGPGPEPEPESEEERMRKIGGWQACWTGAHGMEARGGRLAVSGAGGRHRGRVYSNYRDAVKLVIHLGESGLRPEAYSDLIVMTAAVKELNEFAKALCRLKGLAKDGSIADLDVEKIALIKKYQSDLLADGVCLSKWVMEEGCTSLHGVVHERLLAMYICAGHGLEAERQLWEMKLVGKEADSDLHDIVLAICASSMEVNAIGRLLTRTEIASSMRKKRTFSWLSTGYIKGGHYDDAADALIKMLDLGVYPDYLDRAAVLRGLRSRI